MTTWSLSFQHLEKVNPAAGELLRLCAFLDPDGIYEEIITEGAPVLGTILSPVASDPFKLNEAIEELLKFSLIRRKHDEKVLIIHRLVQAVIKDSMPSDVRRHWERLTLRVFDRAFQSVYRKRGDLVAFSLLIQIYYNPMIEFITQQLRITNLQKVGSILSNLFIEFYKRLNILSFNYFNKSDISSYIFSLAYELAQNDQGQKGSNSSLTIIKFGGAEIRSGITGYGVVSKNQLSHREFGIDVDMLRDSRFPPPRARPRNPTELPEDQH